MNPIFGYLAAVVVGVGSAAVVSDRATDDAVVAAARADRISSRLQDVIRERRADLIEGCERDVLDRADESGGWVLAATARLAAYERDRQRIDLDTAREYVALAQRLRGRIVDCDAAYPPGGGGVAVIDRERVAALPPLPKLP